MPKMVNLVGKRFGKLLAVAPVDGGKPCKVKKWLCLCDCGALSVVRSDHLQSGHTSSCGCLPNRYLYDGTYICHITRSTPISSNSTGVTGVHLHKDKYVANIKFRNKKFYLGRYSTLEEAAEVRKAAEDYFWGGVISDFITEYPDLWQKLRAARN